MNTQKVLAGFIFSVVVMAGQGSAVQAEEPRAREVRLDELESFTDQINVLTRTMEDQKLELERLKKERDALAEETAAAAAEAKKQKPDRETLDLQIKELETAYADNEKELEKFSSKIEKSHGFAPELFRSSALSDSSQSR